MKPFEIKDHLQGEIRIKGEEYANKFIAAITHMYTHAQSLQLMKPEKANLILLCASNVIICNVRHHNVSRNI